MTDENGVMMMKKEGTHSGCDDADHMVDEKGVMKKKEGTHNGL
jgi:hypothetical protein